ncbi:type IV pilus assembly protein PilM [Thermovibrio sp.]
MGWLSRFLKGSGYLYPALDVGTSSLKLVQSERKGSSYKVKTYGVKEYGEQVFAGTEIIDEFELIRSIKELFKELKVKDKQVIIHVPLNSCFYSVLSVPATKDPEEAVTEYMQSIISPEEFPLVKIDYRVLPISIEKGNMDIAIAAVRKDFLEGRIKLLQKAGLEPVVIDIEPAAINNQFYLNNPEQTATPVCLVDIGASYTKVIISFGGYPYITRNVEYGGISLTEQIQKEFMLSFEDAERLKRGEPIKEYKPEDIKEIALRFLKKIITETLWTIENFKDRFNLDVDSIYLYGGTAKLEGIEEVFNELTGKECVRGAPLSFAGIPECEEFAVATGLSLRYKGDKNAKV